MSPVELHDSAGATQPADMAVSDRPAPRVLLVDDEEDTRMLTEAILSRRGYEVRLADSGRTALAMLAEDYDAVLLDVMMPEMSGLEVLSRIRETPRLARLPVILLTARQRDRDLIEGYRDGADYYITKPCTAEQIEYGLRLVLGDGGALRRTAG